MPNVELDTGMTIYVSAYEYYIVLQDEDMEAFFQNCKADNLGVQIDYPFSNRRCMGTLEREDAGEIPDDSLTEEPDWLE
jgi:hypothetical protein